MLDADVLPLFEGDDSWKNDWNAVKSEMSSLLKEAGNPSITCSIKGDTLSVEIVPETWRSSSETPESIKATVSLKEARSHKGDARIELEG